MENLKVYNDEDILFKIKNTNLFNPKLKQELILYYIFLTLNQKNNLLEALNIEQKIVKDFLASLRNKEKIDFIRIKGSIEKLKSDNRKLRELNEKLKEENEINNLLSSLEIQMSEITRDINL